MLSGGTPTGVTGPLSVKISLLLKPLVTPLNTRGTGVAQRSLIKAFSDKGFRESRFRAPLCFPVKNCLGEYHSPKFSTRVPAKYLQVTHDISTTTASFQSGMYIVQVQYCRSCTANLSCVLNLSWDHFK